MSDDIVISLEKAATYKENNPYHDATLLRAAADHIRKLEAALREIAGMPIEDEPVICARSALEGK